MRRLAAALLASSLALAQESHQLGDSAPEGVGSVERVQFTSITRDRAQIWVRTLLPKVAKGWKQSFTGELTVANVVIPIHPPLTVVLQQGRGRAEAVFSLDLKIAELPAELLSKVGTQTLDLTLQGTLAGENGSQAPVFAVGLLRFGTSEVEAQRGAVVDFVRLEGARFTGLTLSQTSGEARLLLYNPFSFAIPLKSIAYTLSAGDRRLCGGEKQAVRIQPLRETEIVLPITADNADLIAAAGSAVLSGGTIDGRLTGAVTFRVGRGDVTLPISVAAKIELIR